MKKKTKEQTLPKWFKGLLYTDGETVTKKFSGAEAYCNRYRIIYVRLS